MWVKGRFFKINGQTKRINPSPAELGQMGRANPSERLELKPRGINPERKVEITWNIKERSLIQYKIEIAQRRVIENKDKTVKQLINAQVGLVRCELEG